MVAPPFFAMVISIFFAILLVEFQSAEAAAPALKASRQERRKAQAQAQGQGCDRRFQCYVEKYNLCLHKMSNECVSQRPDPVDFITSAVTPSPTPMPETQSVQQIQFETESPILFRLMNVAEDYSLSASDRTRYVDMIQGQLDDASNDSWEIISVEQTCEYVGERLLQSSQRGRGGGDSIRRLNKILYLPVLVTLRGEEDYLSGMAGTLTLQAIRNKLSILSMNLKSLNPNAFQNLQISVEELNLADVACVTGPIASIIVTSTNVDKADPLWVWMIVAAICIPLGFCLLICTCRNCTFKSRKRVTMDEYPIQKQLTIHYGHVNAYDNGISFDKRGKYRPRRQRDLMYRRSRSEGARRHGRSSRRRRVDERRRYSTNMKRRDYRKTSNRRSLSMVEHEIVALEERNILDERALVALPAHLSAFAIDNTSQVSLPKLEYQENALVVYDDENIRFPLEPEGNKIEDVKHETAVVPYR